MEEEKKENWGDLGCPKCGSRRVLWPIGQNVSSLKDPKCQFIHMNGKEECE